MTKLPLTVFEAGNIKFKPNKIPKKLYRYFSCAEHAENFLNGKIWFSGITRRRFLLPSGFADPLEQRAKIKTNSNGIEVEYGATVIGRYTLSLSLLPGAGSWLGANVSAGGCWVEVVKPNDFGNRIYSGLKDDKEHYVKIISDVDIQELRKKMMINPDPGLQSALSCLQRKHCSDETASLSLGAFFSNNQCYASDKSSGGIYDLPSKALEKSCKFSADQEYRFEISGLIEFYDMSGEPFSGAEELVDFISVSCPDIRDIAHIM